MSQESFEHVYRNCTQAWNEGDVEGFVALLTSDVEIFTDGGGVEGGYRGRGEARRWYQDVHDVFPDWHAEIVSVRRLAGALLVQLHFRGHGGESGVPVDQIAWHIIESRDGRIARFSRYETEAEALEAVGLSE